MGLVHQAAGDFGSILTGRWSCSVTGSAPHRHLADAGRPLTSAELAAAAGYAERSVPVLGSFTPVRHRSPVVTQIVFPRLADVIFAQRRTRSTWPAAPGSLAQGCCGQDDR